MQGDKPTRKVRIVAMSDTHDKHPQIDISKFPQGDIFIHAGDSTYASRRKQFNRFRNFLSQLPYKHKICIAGNHDFGLERDTQKYQRICDAFTVGPRDRVVPHEELQKLKQVCTYVQHDMIEVEGVRIFGSPYVNSDHYEMGFTYKNMDGDKVWANLPQGIDVLVTHCPPWGILDQSQYPGFNGMSVGCEYLRKAVDILKPKVHIFGHIHEGAGHFANEHTRFYNVAYVNREYKASNQPALIEIEVPIHH